MQNKRAQDELIRTQILERRAQFALTYSRYITWAALSITISGFILYFIFSQYPQLLGLALAGTVVTVGMGVYPSFHRRGQVRLGIILALGAFQFACAVAFFMLPEIGSGAAGAYIIVILMSNMLLGVRGASGFSLGCICLGITDVYLGNILSPRWFTPLNSTFAMIANLSILTVIFLIALVFIRQNLSDQESFFWQSKSANFEIEHQAAAERAQRENLQKTTQNYVQFMDQVGRGNLTCRLDLNGNMQDGDDSLRVLGKQLNNTTASLQEMINQIKDAADNLSSASAEILAATTQQASSISEQYASVKETTTTVDEVKTIAEHASTRAQEVTNSSQRSVEVSVTGQKALHDSIESMSQIKERVEGIARNILTLSEKTQQIGEIIATVNELASQSNLLALNASIEAARAGEHGKGFAVVAEEVRTLAEQSRQATHQVKSILSEIQKATNATVMATEEGTKGVDKGVALVVQTGAAIEKLVSVINESAQVAAQLVAGGLQQSTGMEQIALSIQSINRATIQSQASTRQAEQSAQNLNSLARSLAQTVARYQL